LAVVGLARLVHPFPSLLDASLTAAIALVAGAPASVAALLGAAMLCLQASIGALNDLTDLPADAVAKPGKPLVRGPVTPAMARVVIVAGLAVGLAVSAVVGLGALVVALLGVGTGYLYDLRLKGTGLAWLPFALGVPLLPVYAWIGATGTVPRAFAVLVPAAVAAGAALALGNQLADLAADRRAGVDSTARTIGRQGALAAIAALHAGVALAAIVSLVVLGGQGPGTVVAVVGIGIVALGVGAAAGEWGALTQRAWELQASGTAVLAAGWVAALAETGALAS
jgi:4-hydroxybenzoate polyprenyltransferase